MKSVYRPIKACLLLTATLCLAPVLSGCLPDDAGTTPNVQSGSQVSGLTEAQEAALVSRVEGKWRAMELWDFATVYQYTTPTYRKVFSKSMYLNKFGSDLRWELTGVDVLNYDAESAVASVAVRVMSESTKPTTLAAGAGFFPDTVKEKWFLLDGEWWNNAK